MRCAQPIKQNYFTLVCSIVLIAHMQLFCFVTVCDCHEKSRLTYLIDVAN